MNQTEPRSELVDPETPAEDAFEQSLPVDEVPTDGLPVDALPDDAEVPEPDAIEQHHPAPAYDDEGWR